MNLVTIFEFVQMSDHQLPKKYTAPFRWCTKFRLLEEWKYTFKMTFQKFGHHLWSRWFCTLQMWCHFDTANEKNSTQHDQKVY